MNLLLLHGLPGDLPLWRGAAGRTRFLHCSTHYAQAAFELQLISVNVGKRLKPFVGEGRKCLAHNEIRLRSPTKRKPPRGRLSDESVGS
jgi:hypothetical protein